MAKYLIADEGLLKGLILVLEENDEYKIGRDPDLVDFVLDDPSVSRKHALVFKEEDGFCITDLSHTNPTIINDQPIVDTHLLKEGDIIKIGETSFKFTEKKPNEIIEDGSNYLEDEEKEPEIKLPSAEEENVETLTHPLEKEEPSLDTIFEEEIEEELPFNIISENTFTLKVISGSNAGAEFGMDTGKSYIIGKDPQTCDIIFNDLSVSKEHAKISVDENNSCFIDDLNSKNGTFVNSGKIKKKTAISPSDIILIGSTSFIIINPEVEQETLYTTIPTYEEKVEEEIVEEELDLQKEKTGDWKEIIIPKKHLVIGSSFLITLFVIFLTFFSLFKSEKVEIKEKKPTEEIQLALKKFPAVEFSFNPANGKLFLVGHVLTATDAEELKYNIDNIASVENVENNVIIDEFVWKNTNNLLNDTPAWRSVSVHSPKAGLFVVAGYIPTAEDLENLSDYLLANFPYIDKLQNKVVIEDLLKTEIAGLILSNGLSTISYQLVAGEVILAGRYGTDDEKSYQHLIEALKKLNGVRSIKNAAVKTSSDMARIDLTSKYRITGSVTSDHDNVISVLANNKLITTNDFLDGMKVTEIKTNTIYLEKDGLKYKIDYIR